jgi:hypothetical protein
MGSIMLGWRERKFNGKYAAEKFRVRRTPAALW